MALSLNTVFECRNGGSDVYGGGFVTGASGTDWSQQTAAQYSVADGVTAGTTTITSATANFGTDVVGNIMYVAGGTGAVTAGWYQITVRNSSLSVTVDRSTGLTAGTGVTLTIGGCFATPGRAVSLMTVSGQKTWWKYNATDFTVTTGTAGPAGPISFSNGIVGTLQGYDATRGDNTGNRPCINWGAAAHSDGAALVSLVGNAAQQVINIKVDANNLAESAGVVGSNSGYVLKNCVIINASDGITGNSGRGAVFPAASVIENCYFANCKLGAFTAGTIKKCTATTCTTAGIALQAATAVDCLAYANTGDGFQCLTSGGVSMTNCTASGNTGDGFDTGSLRAELDGCVATYNTGYGFNASTTLTLRLFNCADLTNTAGHTNAAPFTDNNAITLSADPYVDKASLDFRPNNTAGGGASLKGIALVSVFGQQNTRDVGAVQHTDPAGGIAGNIFGGLVVH